VLAAAPCAVETYGFSPQADWHIGSYRCESDTDGPPKGIFTLAHKGQPAATFAVPMMGRHNARNCAAVAALAIKIGLPPETINDALRQFRGIKRRQEVVGEKNGVVVIDDFAHHPTAIHHTLEAVKEAFPRRRVWAVFEPRSATSRRAVFQKSFPAGFRLADRVVIAKLFAPEKIEAAQRLDLTLLLQDLQTMGKDARLIPEVGEIVDFLAAHCKPGDVVLIMSSGGFGGIHQRLLEQLPSSVRPGK